MDRFTPSELFQTASQDANAPRWIPSRVCYTGPANRWLEQRSDTFLHGVPATDMG